MSCVECWECTDEKDKVPALGLSHSLVRERHTHQQITITLRVGYKVLGQGTSMSRD